MLEKLGDETRDSVDHVLAVVEHEQELPAADRRRGRLPHRRTTSDPRANARGDEQVDVLSRLSGCELDEPDAIDELGRELPRDRKGELGLPDPARAGQRHEPRLLDRGAPLLDRADDAR